MSTDTVTDLSSFTIDSLFRVKGKNVVVTGGATGVGRALAAGFAMNGSNILTAQVIICGRRSEVTEQAAKELSEASKNSGGCVIGIQADVSTKAGVLKFYEDAEKYLDGRLDVLVNNAGFSANWRDQSSLADRSSLQNKLIAMEEEDFTSMAKIHIAAPLYMTAAGLHLFETSEDPCMIMITSMAAKDFLNGRVCEYSYAASKAGQEKLSHLLASTLSTKPMIRVNTLVPGLFPSELTTTDGKGDYYTVMDLSIQNDIPARRGGNPEEIAQAAIMISTNRFMTDSEIRLDGGWLMNASGKDV